MHKHGWRIGGVIALGLLFGACTKNIEAPGKRDPARASPGMLYSIEPLRTYPRTVLRAPIRLYFGSLDGDVSPREAEVEAQRLRQGGGDVTTVDVGAVEHEGSVRRAVPFLLTWFDELTRPTGG